MGCSQLLHQSCLSDSYMHLHLLGRLSQQSWLYLIFVHIIIMIWINKKWLKKTFFKLSKGLLFWPFWMWKSFNISTRTWKRKFSSIHLQTTEMITVMLFGCWKIMFCRIILKCIVCCFTLLQNCPSGGGGLEVSDLHTWGAATAGFLSCLDDLWPLRWEHPFPRPLALFD